MYLWIKKIIRIIEKPSIILPFFLIFIFITLSHARINLQLEYFWK